MRLLFMLTLTLLVSTGCNLVYKQSIQQGNAIEQEDLDKLRIGMTRNQVSFLLGTPAIRDPFHQDRWDYVSTFSRRGEEAVMRKVTLYFEDGTLSEMIGVEGDEFIFEDEAPAEADELTDAEAPVTEDEAPVATVTPLAAPGAEDASFTEALNVIESESVPTASAADTLTEAEPQSTGASETASIAAASEQAPEGWAIQLGAFDSRDNARAMVERLEAGGVDAEVIEQPSIAGMRYLVRKTGIESRTEAELLLEQIASGQGIDGFLVPAED